MIESERILKEFQDRAYAAERAAHLAEVLSASIAAAAGGFGTVGASILDRQVQLDLANLRGALTAWRMVKPK